jgi:hypothetical protein
MRRPEEILEDKAVEKAESLGWFVRKVQWGKMGRRSAPDRVFIKDGRTIWIEFKAKGEEPNALQVKEHKRMRDAGAELYVCDNLVDFGIYLNIPKLYLLK